jgi:NodT family efflux transporter outer membrane factor (OMF) lipoprotein
MSKLLNLIAGRHSARVPFFRRICPPQQVRQQWVHAKPLLLAVVALAFAGCAAVGPDYAVPQLSLPAAWHAEPPKTNAEQHELARWWARLDDPLLATLVERALTGNLDLRQAQGRILEARARRGFAQADRFPTLAARAGAERLRHSDELGGRAASELYSAGFDASWEIDLFGAKQRALEAAEALLQSAEEDLRDVHVSLAAESAINYVEVRAFQRRLAIAQESLVTQGETHQIASWRFEAGLATQLDVDQARTALEQTRSQLPVLRTGLEQAKNRLAILLGEQPGVLEDLLLQSKAIPTPPVDVAVGLPADLLRRRPDIRRVERQLAAQTAQIGVATAALYPKLSLLGSIGLESLAASRLFLSSAGTTSAAGEAAWTLFDAGRVRQNIAVQNALQEQALARYEAAVLGALGDVENALVAYASELRRHRALVDATQAAASALFLATSQYTSGTIDFLPVLEAQRTLLTLQDQLAVSDGETTSDLIRLYKALGGGWSPIEPLPRNPERPGNERPER